MALRSFTAALSGYTPQQFRAAIPPQGVKAQVPVRVRIQSKANPVGELVVIDAARLAATEGGAA